MSLKYGLNVKKSAPTPARNTILDDDDEFEDEQQHRTDAAEEIDAFGADGAQAVSRKTPAARLKPPPLIRKKDLEERRDLSSAHAAQKHVQAAQEVDSSIFDYDSFHDAKTTVTEAKKAAARQDAIERKPKYINNLLDAAAKRKQDQQMAREKLLQREREAEGEEFADKEKFVTGAYKEQQEETRKLEEEEKKKTVLEERRKRMLGGGMQGFYRGMIDQQERSHIEAVEAATKMEHEGFSTAGDQGQAKTEAELAAELRAKGINVHLNEEGQVTDKRELLSAGLNIAPSGKSKEGSGADHLKASAKPAQSAFAGRNNASRDAQRERQSKLVEEQLASQVKRAREEEEEERQKMEKAAKSTKTGQDVSDARARYLARKAAKERGEG